MASLVWGKAQQLWFYDDHEYYQVLGSLCHHDACLLYTSDAADE